jgi:RNA polymerase sigma-70 factor (ECF subfamily)
MNRTFADEVVQHLPKLQGVARRFAGNRSLADDLVQETMLRALVHADQFQTGTNLLAWLYTILRNCYFNDRRIVHRFTSLDSVTLAAPTISGEQEARLHIRDVSSRFQKLSPAQREALLLVGANGHSYEAAAAISGCAVGTMKSRVSRARTELLASLEQDNAPIPSRALHQRDFEHLDKVA